MTCYLAQFHHRVQKGCTLNHHPSGEGQVTYTSQDHQASQGSVLCFCQSLHPAESTDQQTDHDPMGENIHKYVRYIVNIIIK